MTNKELIRLAGNEDAFYYLEEIKIELQNMVHKTEYEQLRAKRKIKIYANMIRTYLAEQVIDEGR